MIFDTNIQVVCRCYNKVYTIYFRTGEGLDRWKKESYHTAAYGGTKAFLELSTTRDARLFDIWDCVKS